MNTKTIRLFDVNGNLVPNFEEEVEKVLISVHGEHYYDTDEELVDTNAIQIVTEVKEEISEKQETEIEEDMGVKRTKKELLKECIPVLFFILIAIIIIIAGYFFLNSFDLSSLVS